MNNKVIVFDEVCLLCNSMVQLLIKWDTKKIFRYTTIQGEFIKQLNIEEGIDSIIFYDEGKIYYKSTAVLKIVRSLDGIWILSNIFYLIPRVVRDTLYDIVAKYRYKIFGTMEHCHIPSREEALFLE